MRQYKGKAKGSKQQSKAMKKLRLAHEELGFKEPPKSKQYYAILSNNDEKSIVIDTTAKNRTHAKHLIEAEYTNLVAQGRVSSGFSLESIRAYQ